MGKLICVVEMDKLTGAKVTVTDEEAGCSQTLTMDGTKVTITVKDSSKTSTFEQQPGRILLKAEEVAIEATTLKMTSTTGTWDSDTIAQKAKSDLKLESQGTLSAAATSGLTADGQTVAVKAKSSLELGAMTIEVKGTQSLKSESLSVAIKGTQLDVQGTMIGIKGSAQLTCESSGMATFKGSLCQLQGALINIG